MKVMKQTQGKTESSFMRELGSFISTLLISLVIVFLIVNYVVRPIKVQGNSMYPTLENDEIGFANVIGLNMNGIDRFDVVIIYMPEQNEYLVKRAIGLPGETVSYTDSTLYINGEAVEETFLDEEYVSSYAGTFTEDVQEVVLGEDEYWCMGDNRPYSRDSRYYGAFSRSSIVAKGTAILFPFSKIGIHTW